MSSITAQTILDENNWTTPTPTIGEGLIDTAIDYVNLEAGRTIAFMSGTVGSKTVALATGEYSIIKLLAGLLFEAYNDKSPNFSIPNVSVQTVVNDPQYSLFLTMITEGINRLRKRGILRTYQ